MRLHEIQHTLTDLRKEYYAIGRTLNFDEWLTAQCMQLQKERDKSIGRANALEEFLSEYRDDLKKGNVFHKNQGIINAINELLNEND